ncbi:MAG: hypothetical protein NZ730_03790 [Porticoccaceae bacterium]|nr:hypothetical protein [Porticoccaceae bacterium]
MTESSSEIVIDGKVISYSQLGSIEQCPWSQAKVDIVVECSGQFKSRQSLLPYLDQRVKKVIVSAPVQDGTLNIVMGVNDHLYSDQDIVTAASCTTNCLAPVIDVLQKEFGLEHAAITTIHDITNTQSILDEYHKDLRRARALSISLIPTSTGSATAIIEIFPELKGRINGIAVRVPLAKAYEPNQEGTALFIIPVLMAAGLMSGVICLHDFCQHSSSKELADESEYLNSFIFCVLWTSTL